MKRVFLASGAALALACTVLFPATAGAAITTYSSSPGAFLGDGGPIAFDTIVVPDSGIIRDLDVTVTIEHPMVGDLVIFLVDPTGGVIVPVLVTELSAGDGLFDVTFDDEAPGPPPGFVLNGFCATGVSYTPRAPLSAFDGLQAQGAWTIAVLDVARGDASDCDCNGFFLGPRCPRTLNEWSLTIDLEPANENPVATCRDVTAEADPETCTAEADVDDGSFDPDDDPITLEQSPAGPYGLGDTPVTLTVTDGGGLSDSCAATVTVVDVTDPEVLCNSPDTITPPDAPLAFTATAIDACGPATAEVTAYDCFKHTKKGKRIDKTESCVVETDGDTVTIVDSGGVGTTIEWTVVGTDGSGNSIEMVCSVEVANPGRRP